MATILNNSATLTYNSGENTGSAASNVVSTSLLDSYSIEAVKTSANDSWRPSENITYLVTVTNTGTQPWYAVEVSDDLGGATAPLAYLANSALIVDGSSVTPVTPTSVNPLVIPAATVLQSGESVTVLYVAQVSGAIPDTTQTITNTAQVTARQQSATGTVVTAVPAPSVTLPREDFAQIDIVKTADKAVISSGDTLTYTFTIENSGNIPATNVVITDTLPAGFAIQSIQSVTDGVTTTYGATDYTVDAGNTLTLPTGGAQTITVPARDESGNGITTVIVTGIVTG